MGLTSRITNSGTYLVNGIFDEVTFNTNNPKIVNLLTYSEQFNNSAWIKTSGITVSPDSIAAPDGSLTADTLTGDGISTGYLERSITYTSGTSYVFSCYAKANAVSTFSILLYGTHFNSGGSNIARSFNLSNGTTSQPGGALAPTSYGIVDCGNGWYRCWISQTATTTASSSQQFIRMSGVSGSIYAWGYQLEVGTTPSIYQPIAASNTLVSTGSVTKTTNDTVYITGTLDEVTFNTNTPRIINLLKYTQELNVSSYWYQGTASTISADVTKAPDKTSTADKIIQTTTTNRHGLQSPTLNVTANTAYTVSCYAKAGENNFVQLIYGKSGTPFTRAGSLVDLTTGAVTTYTVGSPTSVTRGTPVYKGDGWWYIYLTVVIDASSTDGYVEVNTVNSSANGSGYTPSNSTDGTYVWGLQLTEGTSPQIYQPVSATNTLVNTGVVRKIENTGNTYVSGLYDEFTGVPIVDSSLTLWLDAAQPSSYPGTGTTWSDLSGKGNNFSLVNSVTYNNQGWMFYTANTTNFAQSTAVANLATTAISVCCWVKVDAHGDFNDFVYNRWVNNGWLLYDSGTYWLFGVGSSGTQYNAVSAHSNSTDWTFLTGTYDGSNTKLYVNGVLKQTVATPAVTLDTGYAVRVGQQSDPGNYSISSTMIYNRALTADEVTQNYNALKRRYGLT